jgi:arginyl-tRNA synthetase
MEVIKQAIQTAAKDLFNTDIEPELTRPDEQFGDYTTNAALQLAGKLGKNPREIATMLADKITSTNIKKTEIAGPGFLNITLTDEALITALHNKPAQPLAGKVVVAEYSDPNPFKVLHAGHLYTTITGDAIAKLLETAGATVHRLNYGGDVGLHVGKTMWAIIQYIGGERPEKLHVVNPGARLEWLSERYVEGNSAYEENENAHAEIVALNKRVYQLHQDNDHNSPFAQIYWTCRTWSYEGFNILYKQLGITPFEKYVPESEVTPIGIAMVQKGLAEGVFEKSEGAIVFKGEPHGLHTRVFMNSEGLPTYEAKDLGLAAAKWQEYHFDQSVIITANDIVEYMKVVLQALSHFYPEVVPRTRHFTHGVIKLPGGVKMSSRKGNILRATDILDAANEANKTANNQDNEQTVLAAVKYAFLKNRIGGDIIYDPLESVALEGNSGPYLQYAHARARSILAKKPVPDTKPDAFEPGERSLLRKITEYPEVINKAVNELMPHHITTYLYELAQVFNRFYEKNRVIDDPREAVRLQLIQAYADTLKNGLSLLNIPAPEKM